MQTSVAAFVQSTLLQTSGDCSVFVGSWGPRASVNLSARSPSGLLEAGLRLVGRFVPECTARPLFEGNRVAEAGVPVAFKAMDRRCLTRP